MKPGIIFLASLFATHVAAQPKTNAPVFNREAVPYGDEWNCLTMKDKQSGFIGTACVRELDACRLMEARNREGGSLEVTIGCATQAKVAAYTYFDVMQDKFVFDASGTIGECERLRGLYADGTSKDRRNVSPCMIIGARKFEAARMAPFDFEMPKRLAFFCYKSGTLEFCRNSKTECDDMARMEKGEPKPKCIPRKTAFGLTWRQDEDGWFSFYGNLATCEAARKRQFQSSSFAISPCTEIKRR